MRKLTIMVLCCLLAGLPVLSACAGDISPESSVVILQGQEDTAEPIHILALGVAKPRDNRLEQSVQSRIDDINAAGGLAIISHPDTYGFTSNTRLEQLNGYLGIELDDPQQTSRWDNLLTYRLEHNEPLPWAFTSDDMHYSFQAGWGITVVKTTELTSQSVMDAIRSGSFYWGNTPMIVDIATEGDTINVTLDREADIRFIISQGQTARVAYGTEASYRVAGSEGYVRIEARVFPGSIAGTQPLRVTGAGEIQNPYAGPGQWYKGNIHTHTTESDGELTPTEAALLYESKGYTFLGITDHVPWDIPVESEARILGSLSYPGKLEASTAWIGARVTGQEEYCAIVSVEIEGPGVYEYTLPYIPDGVYAVSAILNASGYYLPAGSGDTLAEGSYPHLVTVNGPAAYGNIDFLLADRLP